MAVADVSAAYQNPVGPLLKGLEDEVRRDPARTHYPNHPDIVRILHPTNTGQICAGIGAPVTAEGDNFRFKFTSHEHIPFLIRMLFNAMRLALCALRYSHRAASTMVSTSWSVKWRIAAAPVGQATAQAPQPLQSTSWICESRTPSPMSTSSGAP